MVVIKRNIIVLLFLGSSFSGAMQENKSIELNSENEFIYLIEEPFKNNKKETIDKLSLLLERGINPHKARKSLSGDHSFIPKDYLLLHLYKANAIQKSQIEEMIYMIYSDK